MYILSGNKLLMQFDHVRCRCEMHRSFFAHYNLNCLLNKVIINKNDTNELKPGCSKRLCVISAFYLSFLYIQKRRSHWGIFFPTGLSKKNLNHVALRNQTKEVLTAMLFKYCITDEDF